MVWFLLTLAAGFLPGMILERTKIPMGGTMGALVGAAALNLATDRAVFPDALRFLIMLLSGAMIGSTVGREELRSMGRLSGAIAIVAGVMVTFNLGLGSLLYAVGGLDVATALFAATPGGATDMAIIAGDLGANTAYVAFLQMARGVLFLLIAPSLFSGVIKRLERRGSSMKIRAREKAVPVDCAQAAAQNAPAAAVPFRYRRQDVLLLAGLFASAALGGLLFHYLEISAGMLIGAILAAILYSVLCGKAVYPQRLLPLQKILAGVYIGVSVSRETLRSMGDLLLPTLLMLIGIVIFSLLSGYIVCKAVKIDVTTSLLAASPCGVTELALLSEELGADTATVSIVQVARFVIVVVTFPLMLSAIVHIVG